MTTENVIDMILEKFPARMDTVIELFEESESFRTLCEDYFECQSVIERLRYSLKMVEQDSLHEYLQLSSELREEIMARIESESPAE